MDEVDPYDPIVLPGVTLTLLMTIFGIFGNLNIFWASVRKGRLRSTCNLIIAVTALSDVLHQSAHLVFAYSYISGRPFMSLGTAFYIFSIPAFNACFGAFLVLSIGIDRLFCVLFPSTYNRVETKTYLIFTMIPPGVYSSIILYVCYIEVEKNQDRLIIAMIAEIFVGDSHYYWNIAQAVIYLTSIFIYSSLWLVVQKKAVGTSSKKLIKSLSFIMLTLVVGWLFVGGFTVVFSQIHPVVTPSEGYFLHMNLGWLINLGISANYFIYFAFNDEYRRAFNEQLQILTLGKYKVMRRESTTATFMVSRTTTLK